MSTTRAFFRSGMILCLIWVGLSACSPAARLDCSGDGTVYGRFEDANYGALEFRHGIVVAQPDGSATVLFTDDEVLLRTMRASQYPLTEGPDAAKALGKHLVGFEFDRDGQYKERIVLGNRQGSGWSGADRGSIRIGEDSCARGHAYLDGDDSGVFAVPVWRDPSDFAVEPGGLPASMGTPSADNQPTDPPSDEAESAMVLWQEAWDRLHQPDPAQALQALGLSAGAAAALAEDRRALATLERMRTQCADPLQARFDPEYEEIVGASPSHQGFVFQATVRARRDAGGTVIDNCYVMFRNDASIEQCWPLTQDCRATPPWAG